MIQPRALWQWLVLDPAPFWGAIIPPAVLPLLLARMPGTPELHIRLAGYGLTLLGIGFVLYGLRDTRKLFDKPSYSYRLRSWLARFLSLFRKRVIIMAGSTGGAGISGSATVIVRNVPKNNSISERLKSLERNVELIDQRLTATEHGLRAEIQGVRDSLTEELRKRDSAHDRFARKVEAFAAGSLDVTVIGVAWAVIGQAYGTFPWEIGSWLG